VISVCNHIIWLRQHSLIIIAAVKHLRTLLTLVLTNSEVRKLLSDFSLIGRDLLAKGASKASGIIAPPEEKLRNVDQSAPADQFITQGGRVAGPNETPILEAGIPGTDKTVRAHPHDDQAHVIGADGGSKPVGEYRDIAQSKLNEAQSEAMAQRDQAAAQGQRHAQEISESENPEVAADEKKKGMMAKIRDIRVCLLFAFLCAYIYDYIH